MATTHMGGSCLVAAALLAAGATVQAQTSSGTEVYHIAPQPAHTIKWQEPQSQPEVVEVRSETRERVADRPRDATAWRERGRQRMEEMAQRMNVTDDQRAKLEKLMEERFERFRSWRNDPARQAEWQAMTDEQKREAGRKFHEENRAKMAEILTPEQMTQFDAMTREMWGRGRRGGEPRDQ